MASGSTRGTPSERAGRSFDEPSALGDLVAAAACLLTALVGAFVIVPAWVYVPAKVAGTIDSPAVMPHLTLALLALFGVILLAGAWKRYADAPSQRRGSGWGRAAGMMAICGLYLTLILLVGLPVGTAIALVCAMIYFHERRWFVIAATAVLTPLLLWAFFTYVALVPMPQPVLELGALNLAPSAVVGGYAGGVA